MGGGLIQHLIKTKGNIQYRSNESPNERTGLSVYEQPIRIIVLELTNLVTHLVSNTSDQNLLSELV